MKLIGRYANLLRYQNLFRSLSGLKVSEFEQLLQDMLPRLVEHERQRLSRPNRKRAEGGGRHTVLTHTNDLLLTVVWLRVYPTNEVLAFLFGVSDSTVSRIIHRVLPLLEASGRDTMRTPDPGRKTLADLLKDMPELAVVIDTFEQRVQRPRDRRGHPQTRLQDGYILMAPSSRGEASWQCGP